MTTYFIGDVHGCYDELMTLLQKIHFNPQQDKLIFVGDLINRGENSLAVLRFVRELGRSATMVLGNHDISLIAYAYGVYHGRNTDFPEIMQASDAQELVEWLRQQPLLIYDETLNLVVTHAGIPPRWSIKKARKQAQKAEKKLRGKNAEKYLRYAYEKHEDRWHVDYDKYDKFRYRLNGFARLRFCEADGEPELSEKCPVGEQPARLHPWFTQRKTMQQDGQTKIIFGHWAALGFYADDNAICIDTGCAWGASLTAIKITQTGFERVSVPSQS